MNKSQKFEPFNISGNAPDYGNIPLSPSGSVLSEALLQSSTYRPVSEQNGLKPAPRRSFMLTSSLLEELSKIEGRSDIVVFMDKLASVNGFHHFLISPLGSSSGSSVLSNWPSYLVEFYLNNQTADKASFSEQSRTDSTSIMFDYDLLQHCPTADRYNNLHEIIDSSGLRFGTGYLYLGDDEASNGLVALFASPKANGFSPMAPGDFSEIAASISNKIHSSCSLKHDMKYKISKRELECIRWTAEGKTSYEISVILNLSENTVNNYIATAARKVGAVNRSHMICIAARSGLIH